MFTGAGLGTTPWMLSVYYLLIPVYFTAYSYNLFLDMLIEQGLPGLVIFASVIGLAVVVAVRALRMPTPGADATGNAGEQEALSVWHPVNAARFGRGAEGIRPSAGEQEASSVQHPDPEGIRHSAGEQDGSNVEHPVNAARLGPGVKGLRPPAVERTRPLLSAALVSIGVMLLHGLVDDVAYGTHGLVLLFVPVAIIAALQPRRPLRVPRWAPRGLALTIGLLALLAAWQRTNVSAILFADIGALTQSQVELGLYRTAGPAAGADAP